MMNFTMVIDRDCAGVQVSDDVGLNRSTDHLIFRYLSK